MKQRGKKAERWADQSRVLKKLEQDEQSAAAELDKREGISVKKEPADGKAGDDRFLDFGRFGPFMDNAH